MVHLGSGRFSPDTYSIMRHPTILRPDADTRRPGDFFHPTAGGGNPALHRNLCRSLLVLGRSMSGPGRATLVSYFLPVEKEILRLFGYDGEDMTADRVFNPRNLFNEIVQA